MCWSAARTLDTHEPLMLRPHFALTPYAASTYEHQAPACGPCASCDVTRSPEAQLCSQPWINSLALCRTPRTRAVEHSACSSHPGADAGPCPWDLPLMTPVPMAEVYSVTHTSSISCWSSGRRRALFTPTGLADRVCRQPVTLLVPGGQVFSYHTQFHDVWVQREAACNFSAASLLAGQPNASPLRVEVPGDWAGDYFVTCSVADHCEQGMQLRLHVDAPGARRCCSPPCRLSRLVPAAVCASSESSACSAEAQGTPLLDYQRPAYVHVLVRGLWWRLAFCHLLQDWSEARLVFGRPRTALKSAPGPP